MKKVFILISFVLFITNLQAESSFNEFKESEEQKQVERYLKISSQLLDNYITEETRDAEKYLLKAISLMEKKKMDMNSFLAADIYNTLAFTYYALPSYMNSLEDNIKLYKKSVIYYEKSIEVKIILVEQNPVYYRNTLNSSKKGLAHAKKTLAKTQKKLSK